MLKIKIIAVIVIFATIAIMAFLLYFTFKANQKLKQERKEYENEIKETNEQIKQIVETHEEITKRPNDVGFLNGVNLLHKYSKNKQN